MPGDEPYTLIELFFDSGAGQLPMSASAYIALGSFSQDEAERPMLTTRETSLGALEAQVETIKATLDARIAEAKARFAATTR